MEKKWNFDQRPIIPRVCIGKVFLEHQRGESFDSGRKELYQSMNMGCFE